MDRLTDEKQMGCFASLKDKAISVPGSFGNYEAFWACHMAFNALKAYEDIGTVEQFRELAEADRTKQTGCVWCRDNAQLGLDGANDGIIITCDSSLSLIESDSWEFEISYCPKCGRKLKGESHDGD